MSPSDWFAWHSPYDDPGSARRRRGQAGRVRPAQRRRGASRFAQIEVVEADAGRIDAYAGAVPTDIVLACGVFGNISDEDIRQTVAALPSLCAPGAAVIWTRHRKAPDLTPQVRDWFRSAGFA